MRILSSPMVDGVKCGTDMTNTTNELSSEITRQEFDRFRQKVVDHVPEEQRFTGKNVVGFKLKGKSQVKISLTQWKNRYYFNVEGNPISFSSGQNQVGDVNLTHSITSFYYKINKELKLLGMVLPRSVKQAVASLDIYIHSLTFAAYTLPLNNAVISKLVGGLAHIYNYADLNDQDCVTIARELKLRVQLEGMESIRFDRKVGSNKYWSLALYNKVLEQQAMGIACIEDAKDRLRLDLNLKSAWFANNRLYKLKDIHLKYGNDYKQWVTKLISQALNDIMLQYILSFPTLDLIDLGKYEREFARWEKGEKITNFLAKEWFARQGLNLGLSYRLHRAAHMARLTLGMPEPVRDLFLNGSELAALELAKWMKSGYVKEFIPLQERAASFLPDLSFPLFVVAPNQLIAVNSGLITDVRA